MGTVDLANNTIVFNGVAAGATVTATVVCAIDDNETIQFDSDTSVWLTNTAKGTYDGKETPEAEASIEVEKVAPAVSYQKTGYIDSASNYIIEQDTPVTYTITIKNTGSQEGSFSYSDDLSQADVSVGSVSASLNTGDNVPETYYAQQGNVVSGIGTLEVGQILTITIKGTLNSKASSVTNTLTRPDDGTNDTVDNNTTDETVTFNGENPSPHFTFRKSGQVGESGNLYVEGTGGDATYTIKVTNDGSKAGTISFRDIMPEGVTLVGMTPDTIEGVTLDIENNTITVEKDLDVDESLEITLNVTISSAATGSLTNSLTNIDPGEGSSGGDTDETFYAQKPPAPSLAISKKINGKDDENIVSGEADQTLTFTITGQNTGTASAENVVIKDTDLKQYVDGGELTISSISAVRKGIYSSDETLLSITEKQLLSDDGFCCGAAGIKPRSRNYH